MGHRNINNTLRYTQLIKTEDEFIARVARTVEEACAPVEAEYEYVTEFQEDGVKNLWEAQVMPANLHTAWVQL